jgi:hypothetical protein
MQQINERPLIVYRNSKHVFSVEFGRPLFLSLESASKAGAFSGFPTKRVN